MTLSHRGLLGSLTGGAALATIAPGLRTAFADTTAPQSDILVVIFQRGACDGLQLVAPSGDTNYRSLRPTLGVPASGTGIVAAG